LAVDVVDLFHSQKKKEKTYIYIYIQFSNHYTLYRCGRFISLPEKIKKKHIYIQFSNHYTLYSMEMFPRNYQKL